MHCCFQPVLFTVIKYFYHWLSFSVGNTIHSSICCIKSSATQYEDAYFYSKISSEPPSHSTPVRNNNPGKCWLPADLLLIPLIFSVRNTKLSFLQKHKHMRKWPGVLGECTNVLSVYQYILILENCFWKEWFLIAVTQHVHCSLGKEVGYGSSYRHWSSFWCTVWMTQFFMLHLYDIYQGFCFFHPEMQVLTMVDVFKCTNQLPLYMPSLFFLHEQSMISQGN